MEKFASGFMGIVFLIMLAGYILSLGYVWYLLVKKNFGKMKLINSHLEHECNSRIREYHENEKKRLERNRKARERRAQKKAEKTKGLLPVE